MPVFFPQKHPCYLCTSSYCSFSLVARASTDRSLSVVKRTPACPLHEADVRRVNSTQPGPMGTSNRAHPGNDADHYLK